MIEKRKNNSHKSYTWNEWINKEATRRFVCFVKRRPGAGAICSHLLPRAVNSNNSDSKAECQNEERKNINSNSGFIAE